MIQKYSFLQQGIRNLKHLDTNLLHHQLHYRITTANSYRNSI